MIGKCLFYQQTKYPAIYKNTYWGGFSTNDHHDMAYIFDNRNKFIETHKIEKVMLGNPRKVSEKVNDMIADHGTTIDHLEVYQDTDKNLIFVISPYMPKDCVQIKELEDDGFKMIDPLYFDGAITFMKFFPYVKKANTDYLKAFYEKKGKDKIICDVCGEQYHYSCKTNHLKTKIHKKMAETLTK